jgi:hypothetical protein
MWLIVLFIIECHIFIMNTVMSKPIADHQVSHANQITVLKWRVVISIAITYQIHSSNHLGIYVEYIHAIIR